MDSSATALDAERTLNSRNPRSIEFNQGTISGFPCVTQHCKALKNYKYKMWGGVSGLPSSDRIVLQETQGRQLSDAVRTNVVFSESSIAQGAKKNIVHYLGIAADEPERIKRHSTPDKILPLVDIGWDEAYCRQWCEENDLLSPIYTDSARGGCWFCHNQGVDQLRLLRKNYPDLWALLMKWDLDSPTTFKADGHTVHDYDKRFQAEDEGKIVAGDRKFRWKYVLEEDQE